MTKTNFQDVLSFHVKFGLLAPDVPTHLTERKLRERSQFMLEELGEFNMAAHMQDLPLMADALVDLVYVAMGTAIMLGLPWQELWDEVQRANLAKVRGVTPRNHPVDVTKPPDWTPPRHPPILQRAGYRPEDFHDPAGGVDDARCLDDELLQVVDHG